jgi:hypothetical protein
MYTIARHWTRAEINDAHEAARSVGGEVRAVHGLPEMPEGHDDPEELYVAGELRADGTRAVWLRSDAGPVLT